MTGKFHDRGRLGPSADIPGSRPMLDLSLGGGTGLIGIEICLLGEGGSAGNSALPAGLGIEDLSLSADDRQPPLAGLAKAFLDVTRRRAKHPAIITRDESFDYQWLEHAAQGVAGYLLSHQRFSPGGRVALLLGNSPEYLASFYGTLLAGGVAVPLPPDVETDRLIHILGKCDIHFVLTSPRLAERRTDLSHDASGQVKLSTQSGSTPADCAASYDKNKVPAMVLFTSGSTGDPKGVILTHTNLLSNADSIRRYLPLDQQERALALMPFYHALGNSVLQTHVLAGATLVIDGSLAFPNTVLAAFQRHRITSFTGVPEAFTTLLSLSELGSRPLGDLRYMAVAGGAIAHQSAQELANSIAPAPFYIMYGQSEATARLSYLPPEMLNSRPGSIGQAIPGVELQVVDDNGQPIAPGQSGQIRARGPNIMLGYWGDPQATGQTVRGGWLYTGDIATVDADGFIYPRGRVSALVKIQGFRIHPREVEEFITRHFQVTSAIVVPYQVQQSTRLALYVVPQQGQTITEQHIRSRCVRELPRVKVPSYIELLRNLPLNTGMKVDRPALVRRAEERGQAAA